MDDTSNENATIDKQNSSREIDASAPVISPSERKWLITSETQKFLSHYKHRVEWKCVHVCLLCLFLHHWYQFLNVFKKRWAFDCNNIWRAIGLYLVKFVWLQELCNTKKQTTTSKKKKTVLIKTNLTIKYKNFCYKFVTKVTNLNQS